MIFLGQTVRNPPPAILSKSAHAKYLPWTDFRVEHRQQKLSAFCHIIEYSLNRELFSISIYNLLKELTGRCQILLVPLYDFRYPIIVLLRLFYKHQMHFFTNPILCQNQRLSILSTHYRLFLLLQKPSLSQNLPLLFYSYFIIQW